MGLTELASIGESPKAYSMKLFRPSGWAVVGVMTHVPPVKAVQLVDPTGCGDAFRGALLFGLERGWSLVDSCALGNRVGAHKIATPGCQNYTLETIRPL